MEGFEQYLKSQNDYFLSGQTRSIEVRKSRLKKLADSLDAHQQELLQALQDDFGKSPFETIATELLMAKKEISTTLRNLSKWAKNRRVGGSFLNWPSRNYIACEPYGVCLIISPWNYPFILAIQPLISALAAGNCVILKPSEHSPNTSGLLHRIISECFHTDYVRVVIGDASVAEQLQKLNFDYVFFTGSTEIGKKVMEAASRHLTPVTLELGGKSPCLVTQHAELKLAAKRIVWGKLVNAGQTCIAPDYVLIHESVVQPFLEELVRAIQEMYGSEIRNNPDFPRIIHHGAFNRLVNLMQSGTIYSGGVHDASSLYISPTVLTDVRWEMPVMQEEIFGPILPVLTYNDLHQAFNSIRSRPKPLAFYLFSTHRKEQKDVLQFLSFGGACINDTLVHAANPSLPFGGVGGSGIGSYHGKWGFQTFSHQKSVLKKATWIDPSIRYPPYRDKVKWLQKLLRW